MPAETAMTPRLLRKSTLRQWRAGIHLLWITGTMTIKFVIEIKRIKHGAKLPNMASTIYAIITS